MSTLPAGPRPSLAPPPWRPLQRWPLPALASWALSWALHLGLLAVGAPLWAAAAAGCAVGFGLAWRAGSVMRRGLVAAGFPVSLLASGAATALPGWAWLLPLALLALLYPRSAWRDAPLFPTPAHALEALPTRARLAPGARLLDAGCGLGHGLRALRRAYPDARLDGVESSLPLAWVSRATCRFAHIRRADMWADDWGGYDLVYLFQRPESLPRALAKAGAEMAHGAWLASLEFEAAGWRPSAVLNAGDTRRLWLYRLPLQAETAAAGVSSRDDPGR